MSVRFGPSGIGGVKAAVSNLEEFHRLGLRACEVAYTYGVYLKKEDAIIIGKRAKEMDIKLSVHAHYWINLNSDEKIKIRQSKKRILDCCESAHYLGAYLVVVHVGYYGKDREQAYQNIKSQILEIKEEIKKNNWNINIAIETMGKVNVFGGVDEVLRLVKETGCSCCIDFAHLLARYRKVNYSEIFEKLKETGVENIHIHFSGIEYGEKGERRHVKTKENELKELIKALPKGKEIVIINESPDPVGDSLKALEIYDSIK
jgi:deoxyribonuclease-4